MNDTTNEQTEIVSQIAEAKNSDGEDASVSLGKFKDVNALLSAYNSLQAEFTKRCQRIKELEAHAAVDKVIPTEKAEGAFVAGEQPAKEVPTENRTLSITEEEKENCIKGYLTEIMGAKSKAIVMDGFGASVKTPVNKPKTVEEAGKLAKELLAK